MLYGCGTTDMKAGVAVQLRLAATLPDPNRDLTFVFYDAEEIAAEFNGLGRLAARHPEWLAGDFAVLLEPTDGPRCDGGCQGTPAGRGAHHRPARALRPQLARRQRHPQGGPDPRPARRRTSRAGRSSTASTYPEGLNAVMIEGGARRQRHPRRLHRDRQLPLRARPERGGGARPRPRGLRRVRGRAHRLRARRAARPVAAGRRRVRRGDRRRPVRQGGWTDVARFSALGVPAVNYGPGDPMLAHTREEYVETAAVLESEERLRRWLSA